MSSYEMTTAELAAHFMDDFHDWIDGDDPVDWDNGDPVQHSKSGDKHLINV